MILKRIAYLFSLGIFILFSCKSRFITPINQPVSEENGNAEVNIIAEKKIFQRLLVYTKQHVSNATILINLRIIRMKNGSQ